MLISTPFFVQCHFYYFVIYDLLVCTYRGTKTEIRDPPDHNSKNPQQEIDFLSLKTKQKLCAKKHLKRMFLYKKWATNI